MLRGTKASHSEFYIRDMISSAILDNNGYNFGSSYFLNM